MFDNGHVEHYLNGKKILEFEAWTDDWFARKNSGKWEMAPEDIRKSVPIIKEILSAMNIPVLEVEGFEADDIIGTLAKQAASQNIETFMLTPDKDYGQIVNDNIYMFRPRHGGGYETLDSNSISFPFAFPIFPACFDGLAVNP